MDDRLRVNITETLERFSEVLLEDGTVLKIRAAVTEVVRIQDKWDADGKPVYYVKSQNILAAECPPHLINQEVAAKRQGGGKE